MDDNYKDFQEYNPGKGREKLIVPVDMIPDILNPVVIELFIRDKKLNISLAFITQYYFNVPKNIRLNSKPYFIMEIQKIGLQQMVFTHSLDIDYEDFMNL